ncbi:hypothetical protein B0I33_102502 [Prauserella shujinwangii]|uniref:Uncharacterized protein n=1 Tax=Prauserella shujinwangii TaxID=1453103 RepID=A0A2T0M1D6_9PSEU|nr:hypothetical protein [Prauserella shujinwangii]PRX50381.1 hypothetical protein B0I33_102502 [Prauserella shujinwangii]
MGGLRLFLTARAALPISTLWVPATLVSLLFARHAIPVDYARFHEARDIPIIEFVPIVTACVVAGLLRPRMAEWERLAVRRVGLLCGMLTVATTAMAVLPVLVAATRLPDHVSWEFVPANVMTVTAVACALAALLGATTGAVLTLLVFLGACLVQNLAPAAAHVLVPLGRIEDPDPHWLAAGTACLLSVVITAHTRGAGAWSRSRS